MLDILNNRRHIQWLSLSVLSVITVTLFGMLFVLYLSGQTLNGMRTNLNAHQFLSDQKLQHQAELLTGLGHNGLVHHYYRYLLTLDETDASSLDLDINRVLRAIETYSVLNITTTEATALERIRTEVLRYENAFRRLQADPGITRETLLLNAQDISTALAVLRSAWQSDETAFRSDVSVLNNRAMALANILLLSTPLILLIGILTWWLTQKLLRALDRNRDARTQVEAQRQRLQMAEHVAFLGHWHIDLETKSVTWSEGMYRLNGVSQHVFKPHIDAPLATIHKEDVSWVNDAIQAAAKTPQKDFEIEFRMLRRGEEKPCYAYASGHCEIDLKTGRVIGLFGILQDISKRKRAEKTAQQYANDIMRQNRDLEDRNAELKQFAHVASHDLQEPLRMVSSYCGLINKRYRSELVPEAQEFLDYALDGAQRMQGLIRDLLSFSRVGKSEEPPKEIYLYDILREVEENLADQIEAKGAKLVYDQELPRIEGYHRDLIRLFQNLITNGLKYNEAKVPTVTVASRTVSEGVEITVKDNGIGISEAFHDKIFEMFKRLHTRDEYSGTGIGLAIVKKVVSTLDGTISVSSKKQKGTTFVITIPALQHDKKQTVLEHAA